MAYIDTSALVPYYCPESRSAAAEEILRRDPRPAISSLTEVEFASALALKARVGDVTTADARRVLARFRTHCRAGAFQIVPLAAGEFAQAYEWIAEFTAPLRTVDALHLAAASRNRLPLVTADKGLARSAEHFGIPCRLLP